MYAFNDQVNKTFVLKFEINMKKGKDKEGGYEGKLTSYERLAKDDFSLFKV